jgi:hypothetical protein
MIYNDFKFLYTRCNCLEQMYPHHKFEPSILILMCHEDQNLTNTVPEPGKKPCYYSL